VFGLGAAAAVVATGVVRGERVGRGPGAGGRHVPIATPGAGQGEPRAFAVLVAAGGLLASGAANGLVAYLVVYASGTGLSPDAAGILLAAASLTCAATRIRLGVRSDRRAAPPLPQLAWLISAALSIGAAAAFLGARRLESTR
jgi:hypothetical protein